VAVSYIIQYMFKEQDGLEDVCYLQIKNISYGPKDHTMKALDGGE